MHHYNPGNVAWSTALQQPVVICGIAGGRCDGLLVTDGQIDSYDCPLTELEPTDQHVELDRPADTIPGRVDAATEELAQIRAACAAVVAQRTST